MFKGVLIEALESDCAKCSEKQRAGAKKVLGFLIKNKKTWYDELVAKYDPEGKYRKQYQAEAEKDGLKV